METTEIAKYDLSLLFDNQARLWKFRSTRAMQGAENATLDAHMTAAGLVVTLATPDIQPGDVEVNLEGHVLHITGKGPKMAELALTVGVPRRIAIADVQTAYADGVFEVSLPARGASRAQAEAKNTEAKKATEATRKEIVTV